MIRSQVAQMFAIIAFYDARIQFDEGKLVAWDAALSDDMPFEFARQCIVNHYASTTDAIMPAVINEMWRIERDRLRSERDKFEWAQELESRDSAAVPMPEAVREIAAKMMKKDGINPVVLAVECPRCGAKPSIECSTPSGVKLTLSYAHPSRFEKAGLVNAQVAIPQRKDSSDS